MSLAHEYALVGGLNRASIGRWIRTLASVVSAGAVFALLTAFDLAKHWGLDAKVPPTVLSLVGAGVVYTALYWFFDRHFWRLRGVRDLLGVPDLEGRWRCEGVSLESEPHTHWTGEIVVVQSWDRIRVHLQTRRSSSDSVAAALIYDAAVGHRLMYHYVNTPRIGERQLAAHHGFAELVFAPDANVATGEYFNGRGRNTFGNITLEREDA
jgi:hypothetical protein